jgi:hypothetical protein
VRAAWLRRLPQEDFVPPAESRWALESFLGRQPEGGWEARADEAAAQEEEQRLRGEVEAFAEQFWDLSPEERGGRWMELLNRNVSASLYARLHLLEPGLGVISMPAEADADARVIELARHVRDLFVLRRGPRARARQVLLRRMANERKEWKAAVLVLRHSYPALAGLGGELLDKLQTASPESDRLPDKPAAFLAPTDAEGKTSSWPIWLVVVVVMGVVRGLMSSGDQSPSSNPKPNFPAFQEQKFRPRDERNWKDKAQSPLLDEVNPDSILLNNEETKKLLDEMRRDLEKKMPGRPPDKSDRKSP